MSKKALWLMVVGAGAGAAGVILLLKKKSKTAFLSCPPIITHVRDGGAVDDDEIKISQACAQDGQVVIWKAHAGVFNDWQIDFDGPMGSPCQEGVTLHGHRGVGDAKCTIRSGAQTGTYTYNSSTSLTAAAAVAGVPTVSAARVIVDP